MIEIERKFLLNSEAFKEQALRVSSVVQGFLNTHPDRTVRVRILDNVGFITVKGPSNYKGTTRFEWETEIGHADARALLTLCEPGVIEKTRYEVPVGSNLYEIDEFHGDNSGLLIAEIELNSEEEIFEKPDWLGKEVTGDIRYYNSSLSKQPYNSWKDES